MPETTTFPCPLCGRDRNRRGDLFTDPNRTAAHIDGSHDADHADERGADHLNAIREGESIVEQAGDSEGEAAEQTPTVADGAGAAGRDGGATDDMVPIEVVKGMEDELAAANRRIHELEEEVDGLNSLAEELSAKVPEGLERCPDCDEPLGLTDNLPDKRFNCSGCGAGPLEVTADS